MKRAYYYLFYKIYKFSEAAPSRWWSDWKAYFVINILIGIILLSIGGYYTVITKKDMLPVTNPSMFVTIIFIAISVFNYFIFFSRDQWKKYVKEFDHLEKRKNKIGSLIIGSVILLIIANLVFMFYLMSQIDWKQYR